MLDWASLQAFVLTAEQGSTLAAARKLGINQTTVMRRIQQLERDLGVGLFFRHQQGYQITSDGKALLPQAEALAKQAEALFAKAKERRRKIAGTVRITTTELVATHLLPKLLAKMRQPYPHIQIDVVATDSRLDLSTGEADIAIRAGGTEEDKGIVRRRVADSVWSVYIGRALLESKGQPASEAEIKSFPIIAGEGILEHAPPLTWLRCTAGEGQVAFRSNSLAGLLAATRAGLGLSTLPALAAKMDPALVRCTQIRSFSSPVWLCFHESRRNDPLLRTVMEFIGQEISDLHHLFG